MLYGTEKTRDPKRVLAGRIGGYRLAATRNPLEYTANARAAFEQKFREGLDPSTMPVEEIERRAAAAKKAWYAELAMKRWRAQKAGKRGKP